MAPLLRELSSLEVEPLQVVEPAPGREGLYTSLDSERSQESNLETLVTLEGVEVATLLTAKRVFPVASADCCCCCPVCCCLL